MTGRSITRFACILAATLMSLAGSATRAVAAEGAPDWTMDFPAGTACSFHLGVEGWGNPNRVQRFPDPTWGWLLSAGKGSTLVFTNLDSLDPQKRLGLKANGSVIHISLNPDGSSTQTLTGHNVLILYPTDVPAGPSTTLYVGDVVFTSDASFNYTLQSVSGTSTDICAALSN